MKNRNVGYLIVGIAVLISVIIYLFNVALVDVVASTCSHGGSCSMHDAVAVQTWLSLSIAGIIFAIGLFLIFSKESERIIVKTKTRTLKAQKKKIDMKGLNKTERKVIQLLKEENAIFQKTLMEKLEIGKVGMTRLLDKLEAKQIIERKRRGMNNVVVLKN